MISNIIEALQEPRPAGPAGRSNSSPVDQSQTGLGASTGKFAGQHCAGGLPEGATG